MSPRSAKPRTRRPSPAATAKSKAGKSKPAGGKPAKLRIIGGDMRGRTVLYHGDDFTRPMKDNIRENLFNILGMSVKGSICFDLFAGTGALGFEAVSRGASSAILIEQHRKAADFIRRTAESLDITSKIDLRIGDTFRIARDLLTTPAQDTPWVVMLCPPYAFWTERAEELIQIIRKVVDYAPPGSILVAETEKDFDTSGFPGYGWEHRIYGGTKLAITRPASACGM